jgi:hypothetical protein
MAAAAVADQLDKDVWPLSKSQAKSPEPIVHLFPQTVPIFWPLDRSAQEPGDGTRPTRFPIPGSIVVPRCRGWPIFYSLRQSQEATCRTWLGQVAQSTEQHTSVGAGLAQSTEEHTSVFGPVDRRST